MLAGEEFLDHCNPQMNPDYAAKLVVPAVEPKKRTVGSDELWPRGGPEVQEMG